VQLKDDSGATIEVGARRGRREACMHMHRRS
jgi:hypothetical protein